jgi:hypothetical protein
MATVPLRICICASGATDHLVLEKSYEVNGALTVEGPSLYTKGLTSPTLVILWKI